MSPTTSPERSGAGDHRALSRDRVAPREAAADNGFDQELPREGDWLGFASTQCPLRVWLGTFGEAVFLAAFSQQNVARALGEYGTPMTHPLPNGALGGRTVGDIAALHRLLRRALQLGKALP